MSFCVSNLYSQKKMIKKILHYLSQIFPGLFITLQIHNRYILPVMHHYVFIFFATGFGKCLFSSIFNITNYICKSS